MLDRGWRTVICAASGPSFDEEQGLLASKARQDGRCRVIVVNDAWKFVPDAECLYACARWWGVHIDAVRAGFGGELWTQDPKVADENGLRHVRSRKGVGVSDEPGVIFEGGNSGFQALMLALQFGARRVVLIGYDMKRRGGRDGRVHFFGDHPLPLHNATDNTLRAWADRFALIEPRLRHRGVTVINATKETAITCFPRMSLEEALELEAA